jgi:hypothetical protein
MSITTAEYMRDLNAAPITRANQTAESHGIVYVVPPVSMGPAFFAVEKGGEVYRARSVSYGKTERGHRYSWGIEGSPVSDPHGALDIVRDLSAPGVPLFWAWDR